MNLIETMIYASARQIEQLSVGATQPLERWATFGSITPMVIATLIAYVYIVFRPRSVRH